MKKLLLLGGLRYLIPVIEVAHKLGIYVITCDYIPDNIAHRYSDEFHNVSIIDKEAVLKLAQELKIDGIMSFAVDPGVITAAYVAEKMRLPFAGPYESIRILQNKDLFRKFLAENGFNVPVSGGYECMDEIVADIGRYVFPLIVKPVDSAGSKGVKRVNTFEELATAFEYAQAHSFSKRVVVEEFIEQDKYSSDSDCFSIDGKLVFGSFSDQMFEKNVANPYTPAAYIWPSTMNMGAKSELECEIQRLFKLLGLKSSIYNIETRVGKNGVAYIMEVSPRGGGNRISEILSLATGVNLIEAAIKTALGDNFEFPGNYEYNGCWAELILYSDQEGKFKELHIDHRLQPYLVEKDLWVKKGDRIHPFTGANETIGTLVFRFDTKDTQESIWKNIRNMVRVEVI